MGISYVNQGSFVPVQVPVASMFGKNGGRVIFFTVFFAGQPSLPSVSPTVQVVQDLQPTGKYRFKLPKKQPIYFQKNSNCILWAQTFQNSK